MKKGLTTWVLFTCLLVSLVGLGASRIHKARGNQLITGFAQICRKIVMTRTLEEGSESGCILTPVRNKKGSTLYRYQIVVWDATAISVVATVARVASGDTFTIANSLKAEKGWYDVRIQTFGLASACTVFVTGQGIAQPTLHELSTPVSSAFVDTVAFAATGTKYITHRADSITMVNIHSFAANESLKVDAYTFGGVTTTASAGNVAVAGVVIGTLSSGSFDTTIVDNAEGYIVTYGPYKAKLDCSLVEGKPGIYVETDTLAGRGAPNATETTGAGIGYLMEAGNLRNGYYTIFVNKE